MMGLIAQLRKALVPIAVGGVLGIVALVGVLDTMTVKEAVTLLVTSGLVWVVPNQTK